MIANTPLPDPKRDFSHIDVWIFDLDNTLYPAECNLFAQVDQKMGQFIANFLKIDQQEARKIQKEYYYTYGTTLRGLMQQHDLAPERFLEYVHDIDVSAVPDAPELNNALAALPGQKYIFTNGSRKHAENVAGKLGVLDHFDDVFDIAAAEYRPKPHQDAYHTFLKSHNVDANKAAMFEDLHHNLEAPHDLGMVTVLVKSSYLDHPVQDDLKKWQTPPEHIHHITDDLSAFLAHIVETPRP